MSEHCKKRIYGASFSGHNCSRAVWSEHSGDGFCKQHHPITEACRRKKRDEKWKTHWDSLDRKQRVADAKEAIVLAACAWADGEPLEAVRDAVSQLRAAEGKL